MIRPLAAIALALAASACDAPEGGEPPSAEPAASARNESAPSPTPAPPVEEGVTPMPTEDGDANGCGADKLDRWLNVMPTADVKAEIAATVGERPIRYYTQGDPITMDFSPARLNVELGEDGRIKLFRCG